jgi:hypothetical protein
MSTVTISAERYLSLTRSELVLEALEAGGVASGAEAWPWYSSSIESIHPAIKKIVKLYEAHLKGEIELTKELIDGATDYTGPSRE